MSDSRLFDIIRSPVVSEKSTAQAEKNNTIVLKVLKDASKDEVKTAVEKIFNVKVGSVRTLNFQGKVRRTNRGYGKRSDWKKAYITLAEGNVLDIESAATQANKENE